jgi:hypothetical protein
MFFVFVFILYPISFINYIDRLVYNNIKTKKKNIYQTVNIINKTNRIQYKNKDKKHIPTC